VPLQYTTQPKHPYGFRWRIINWQGRHGVSTVGCSGKDNGHPPGSCAAGAPIRSGQKEPKPSNPESQGRGCGRPSPPARNSCGARNWPARRHWHRARRDAAGKSMGSGRIPRSGASGRRLSPLADCRPAPFTTGRFAVTVMREALSLPVTALPRFPSDTMPGAPQRQTPAMSLPGCAGRRQARSGAYCLPSGFGIRFARMDQATLGRSVRCARRSSNKFGELR